MRLLVTGAAGFLGRCVVAEALDRGHTVRAVIRPATDVTTLPWHDHARFECARIDLRVRPGIRLVLSQPPIHW